VNGSKASNSLHEFLNNYSIAFPALIATTKRLDTIKNEKPTDSILTVVNLEKEQQLQKVNATITNAFKNTTSPAFRYYLIAKAFATMPINQIKELSTVATSQQPNHSGLAFIKSIVTKETDKQKTIAIAAEKQRRDSILKTTIIDTSRRIIHDSVKLPARDSQ
jgi:ribulose 1,5-bisphosphate carboxylase large subunit-like protein